MGLRGYANPGLRLGGAGSQVVMEARYEEIELVGIGSQDLEVRGIGEKGLEGGFAQGLQEGWVGIGGNGLGGLGWARPYRISLR